MRNLDEKNVSREFWVVVEAGEMLYLQYVCYESITLNQKFVFNWDGFWKIDNIPKFQLTMLISIVGELFQSWSKPSKECT